MRLVGFITNKFVTMYGHTNLKVMRKLYAHEGGGEK
jgi:hypothetical protein